MKHVLLTLALLSFLVVGCAGLQPQEPQTVNHVIEIKVAGENGTPVKMTMEQLNQRINKTMEVPNHGLKLSQLSSISYKQKKAYIKIFSGLSVADVTRSWGDVLYLHDETDIRDLHVFINSPGGDAFSGLALANMLMYARWLGFKVTAHASGIIASAAVPVLAVCDYRISHQDTIFMVHEAALWKWPGRETASDIRAQSELMELLKTRYLGILTSNTTLPYDKWEVMESKTKWFDAEKAKDWGLIDEILQPVPRKR